MHEQIRSVGLSHSCAIMLHLYNCRLLRATRGLESRVSSHWEVSCCWGQCVTASVTQGSCGDYRGLASVCRG